MSITPEAHQARHAKLHQALDELTADYIAQTGRMPSQISFLEIMEWSYRQTLSPTDPPNHMPYPEVVPPLAAHLRTMAALQTVLAERQRQDAKWGEQNHPPIIWLAIMGEEVGEANQASLKAIFNNKPWAEYRQELVQVAAVAVAALECFDRQAATGLYDAQP